MRCLIAVMLITCCGWLSGEELLTDTNKLQSLTVEQAKDFVRLHPYKRDLNGLKTLGPDIALILSRGIKEDYMIPAPPRPERSLSLNRLIELSPETASALAGYSGELRLGGIVALDTKALSALVSGSDDDFFSNKKKLQLNGISHIDHEAAVALATYRGGTLSLGGLSSLTPKTAKALSAYQGNLYLGGIRSLSAKTATALLGNAALHLDGLIELPVETATVLADSYRLHLDGLESISPEAARAFLETQKFFNRRFLSFGGLKEISDKVAEIFVRGLGDGSVEEIALHGLEVLTNKSLAEFLCSNETRRQFTLYHHFTENPSSIHPGPFASLKTLSPDVAQVLSSSSLKMLDLRGLQELRPEIASILGSFEGHSESTIGNQINYNSILNLDGLTSISKESLESLRDAAQEKATDRIANEQWKPEFTVLGLSGLQELSAESASVVSQINATNLYLNGLREISHDTAVALSKSKRGNLRLDGLTKLSGDAAEKLIAFKGSIRLNGLQVIDEKLAKVLAKTECSTIDLSGISTLPDVVEKVLASSIDSITERDRNNKSQRVHRIRLRNLNDIKTAALAKALSRASESYYKKISRPGSTFPERLDVDAEMLSAEAAEAIVSEEWPDEIVLGLQPLTPEIIRIFVASNKPLEISIINISPAVAQILATHESDLKSFDCHNLSVEAANALQPHKHSLTLSIADCSPDTLDALAKHEGELTIIGLQEFNSVHLARKLVESAGAETLNLHDVEKISSDVVEVLMELPELYLPSLHTLSPDAADALAKYEGYLELPELTSLDSKSLAKRLASEGMNYLEITEQKTLSPEVSDALAKFSGELSMYQLSSLSSKLLAKKFADQNWQGINLESLNEISPEAANVLVQTMEDINLSGLTTLPPKVAKVLSTHSGTLYLTGITNLNPDLAETFLEYTRHLSLGGLKPDDVATAKVLAKYGHELEVTFLGEMTLEVATALVKFQGESLYLNFETEPSQAVIDIFESNPRITVW